MIIVHQEIAVHLSTIRNLTSYTSGRFALRISIKDLSDVNKTFATPYNIIQKNGVSTENKSEVQDQYYISKSFSLKAGVNIDFNQICLFKLKSSLFQGKQQQKNLLLCQIIQIEATKNKVVGQCKIRQIGNSVHQYLQIDFYQTAPCQVIGSIHTCIYKYQFQTKNQTIIGLQNYLGTYCKGSAKQMIGFLRQQIKFNYNQAVNNYFTFSAKDLTETLQIKQFSFKNQQFQEQIEQPRSVKQLLKNKQHSNQIQNLTTQADQEHCPNLQPKRKRKKIFATVKQIQSSVTQQFQLFIQNCAQKIFQIWRKILQNLFQKYNQFLKLKGQQYRKKLKQKVCQSIIRFTGQWDIDIFQKQQKQRNKLINQIRNQDKQFLRTMKTSTGFKIFNAVNESFFSSARPIFFQQISYKINKKIKQKQEQVNSILVILVHGLGACRLDMEKIKAQLRRYYQQKVKIFISSCNQGRTQGDIQQMGNRLASQVDYQLSKLPHIPKICFLGHSMGGVIIRTALPKLQKYKKYFHSYISLSSPHLGYSYSTSKLIDAGLWVINTMKKCTSILQLTMQDSQQVKDTFIYKLSKKKGLQWFNKIILLASGQDLYVPYYSARIQKHQQCLNDQKHGYKSGKIYSQMVESIFDNFEGKIVRLNVNFCIAQQNLDNLIGRAAHISFITNLQMLRAFVVASPHYFF